jgi:hypothetical protein
MALDLVVIFLYALFIAEMIKYIKYSDIGAPVYNKFQVGEMNIDLSRQIREGKGDPLCTSS